MRTTRRSALKRALAAVGGLVGLGVAADASAAPAGSRELVLHARGWQTHARGRQASRLPEKGERRTARAQLFDGARGKRVGELHAVAFALREAGLEQLELHTFSLENGTIHGTGTVHASGGVFAITGGTGSFAGARGTYEVRTDEDGTATVVLTLLG
jgi:hypothetical protein